MTTEPLYPEDILNYVPSLRDRARLALEEASAHEKAEKEAKQAETARDLAEAVWDFMVEELGYPGDDLAETEFKTVLVSDEVRLEWSIEGIRMRASFSVFNGSRKPKFEIKSGVAQFGEAWKQFHDLVSLGRLID